MATALSMSFDTPQSNQLIHEIGALIVQSPRIAALDWKHLAFVANVEPGHKTISGFAYDQSGKSRPTSPGSMEALNKLAQLREAMQADGKAPWTACLIRIQRDTGKIAMDFDYDTPPRWAITPATVREMAEKLRPEEKS
jgi:hypothetical protein